MRKVWQLTGGVHLPEHKDQSIQEGIGHLPLPKALIIPLSQHTGAPAKLLVDVGNTVLKGQMLAAPNGPISVAIHAPTSGTISDISDHSIPHPSGMTGRCITLIPDGEDRWIDHQGLEDYSTQSPEALLAIIQAAGIAGLGGAGFPTAVKLNSQQPIDTLIINGAECEPYITADDILMQQHPQDIVEGIKILSYLLREPEHILIGIEDNKPLACNALKPWLDGTNIELVQFETCYPSGGEKQLIQILTGKEVPSHGLPAQLGIICLNIGTTYAIQRAITHGEPLISRITTVTGDACTTNRNYKILIGTPIKHLLEYNGFDPNQCSRLIMGGPMMGFTLDTADVPVIKTTNCILAATETELPAPAPAQACIRCGMCSEACPVSLLPQQLFWYAQSQNYERLETHNLFDCIECGVCSYVCPSNIPLVQYYRASKSEMNKIAEEKIFSDHARARFEFQQARKEKEEAAKAAKREARKRAAEQANTKVTEPSSAKIATISSDVTKPSPPPSTTDDIIKAAMKRAEAPIILPEVQQAKLERGVSRAQNHLDTMAQRLQTLKPSATEQQRDQAKAAIENARIKLKDAQSRLRAEIQSGELVEANTVTSTAQPTKIPTNITDPDISRSSTTDAVALAIAKAQVKAGVKKNLSKEEKLRTNILSLETKLSKAQARLASAEKDDASSNTDKIIALHAGIEKIQIKLSTAKAALTALTH